MAGTTATLALPFPNATDPDDVPADVQRLAERVDAVAVSRLGGSTIIPSAAGVNGLVVRAVSGQTADLQAWQLDDGFTYARVLSDGSISTARQFAAGGNPLSAVRAAMHTGGASVIGLVVRAAASQSASLQEWQNDTGAMLARVDQFGRIGVFSDTNALAGSLNVTPPDAPSRGIVVRGRASQSGALTEWQNSDAAVLARITPAGALNIRPDKGVDTTAIVSISTSVAGDKGIVIRGVSGQTGALQEWQTTGGGAVASRVFNDGSLGIGTHRLITGSASATNNGFSALFQAQNGNVPVAVARATLSHSASIQEWQDANANVLAKVAASGHVTATTGITSTGKAGVGYGLLVHSGGTDIAAILVRGAAGQATSLQEWHNSGGSLLAAIDSIGRFNMGNNFGTTAIAGSYAVPATCAGFMKVTYGGIERHIPFFDR